MITLDDMLALVGTLDDTPGDNTARTQFRGYLAKSASTVGIIRDYIEACLRSSGMQYSRALQDLINHTGQLIGFKVKNVRYFFEHPVVIDVALRSQLDAFKGRDPEGPWAWLVQGTRKVTEHDFRVLTGCIKG